MKKIFLPIILSLFISCEADLLVSNPDLAVIQETANSSVQNFKKRSLSEALDIAESSLRLLEDKETRSGGTRKRVIDCSCGIKAVVSSATRGDATTEDTLMYVFNFYGDSGFAVISANQNTVPVIAMTGKGHYIPEEKTANEAFAYYMELAKEYVLNGDNQEKVSNDKGRVFIHIVNDTSYYSSSYVGNFVPVEWGQDGVEGKYCPNGTSGCVNTAIAQVMSCFRYPYFLDVNVNDTLVVDSHYMNWNEINSHVSAALCSHPCLGDESISLLCRQLGVDTNSTYWSDGATSSTIGMLNSCFLKYRYTTSGVISYNSSLVKSALDHSHVVCVNGFDGFVGHMWVMDGYRTDTYIIQDYFVYPSGRRKPGLSTEYISYDYFHINWGWNGDCNGYFAPDVFDSQQIQYPGEQGNHNYNFSRNLQMVEVYH